MADTIEKLVAVPTAPKNVQVFDVGIETAPDGGETATVRVTWDDNPADENILEYRVIVKKVEI